MPTLGRPRALDDTKRKIVCAIIAAGGTLDGAARYIGCARSTIEREKRRNLAFSKQLSEAEIEGATQPFQLLREAAGSSWRAAAWMLEQSYPERYARNMAPPSKRASLRIRRQLFQLFATKLKEQFAKDKPSLPPTTSEKSPSQP
jgi:hypothetical protein